MIRAAKLLLASSLLLLLLSPSLWAGAKPPYPENYTEKLGSMPDFRQRNEGLAGEGKAFCGPAAAANAIVWLGEHGYPDLLPAASDRPLETVLMEQLGEFMETRVFTVKKGTTPDRLMSGIEQYCDARGYKAVVEFQGWNGGGNYRRSGKPELAWIFEGVQGVSSVLLELGFYHYDASTDRYRRVTGHWTTMVGYIGVSSAKPVLLVNTQFGRTLQLPVVPIESGAFAALRGTPEGPAAGWLKADGWRPWKGDVAVLDGAVRFRVKRKPVLGGTVERKPEGAGVSAP